MVETGKRGELFDMPKGGSDDDSEEMSDDDKASPEKKTPTSDPMESTKNKS